MGEAFGRSLGTMLGAAILAVGLAIGIGKVGSALASRIPDVSIDIPSVTEVVDTIVHPEPYQEIGPAVIDSIQGLAELTTVEYVEHTTIEKGTDTSWLRWARGDGITMLAVAEIGAGVDLAKLDTSSFNVDQVTGVVAMTVPRAEIFYGSLDNEDTQVYDRSTGLFTKGDPQLETEARREAEAALIQDALDNGILTEAQAQAERVLRNFLKGLGYTDLVVMSIAA